jgi:hypothetical protein
MTSRNRERHEEDVRDPVVEEAFGTLMRNTRAPQGFYARVIAQIAAASSTLRDRLVRWVSEPWHPVLAGEIVAAAGPPGRAPQRTFQLEDGNIRVTCEWRAAYQDQPAVLRVAWQARLGRPGDLWVRFTQLEDPTAILAEVQLGSALADAKVFTAHALGFDPTRVPWALTLLLKEPQG